MDDQVQALPLPGKALQCGGYGGFLSYVQFQGQQSALLPGMAGGGINRISPLGQQPGRSQADARASPRYQRNRAVRCHFHTKPSFRYR